MHCAPTATVPPPKTKRITWFRIARNAVSVSPLIIVHAALFAIPFVEFTVWSLIVAFGVTRVTGLGITVGFHRYFSHRSFKTSRWAQFLLGFAGSAALQKGLLWWAVHHRQHHTHSDRELDPHSPVLGGFWYGHLGWMFSRDLLNPDHARVKDLTKYPELVWLDRLWMIPAILMVLACYALMGWNGVVWGFCLGVVLVFQVTFAVNSIGHLFGRQRFDTGEGSRNNMVLGILAMGDGWHNNHHRAPSSARHGFAWYEFDMSYLVIRLLAALGVVWDVKQPPASVMAGGSTPNPTDDCDPVSAEAALVS